MGTYPRTYTRKGKEITIWSYKFEIDGETYYEGGFKTCKEARDAEIKRLKSLNSRMNKPLAKCAITFEQWLPEFIKYRQTIQKSPNTVEKERGRGKVLAQHFGNCRVNEIGSPDIIEYISLRQADGISARTINLELTFLRSFFKHAKENQLVEYNSGKEVPNLPQGIKDEVWIPSKQEFLRFVEAAKTLPTATYFVPWIWFRAYTGTRPTESVYVEWSDLDFEKNEIKIRPKDGNPLKNRRSRTIPMHPELRPILLAWRVEWAKAQQKHNERYGLAEGKVQHDWVFFNPQNHDERVKRFLRSFEHARTFSHLPKMTPHTLRHYFISQCIMSGKNLFTIAQWTGHRNTKMIEEVYGHLYKDYSASEMASVAIVPTPPGNLRIVSKAHPEEPDNAEVTLNKVG